MGSYGISEVAPGAGEQIDWTVNVPDLVPGSGASGDSRTMGVEMCINNGLVEVGGVFRKKQREVW